MSRYIDADEMLEHLDLMYEHQDDKDEPYNIGILGAINYIKHKAPSIDIVRCWECKMGQWYRINREFYLWCNQNIKRVKENDFCSYGERETDEQR